MTEEQLQQEREMIIERLTEIFYKAGGCGGGKNLVGKLIKDLRIEWDMNPEIES